MTMIRLLLRCRRVLSSLRAVQVPRGRDDLHSDPISLRWSSGLPAGLRRGSPPLHRWWVSVSIFSFVYANTNIQMLRANIFDLIFNGYLHCWKVQRRVEKVNSQTVQSKSKIVLVSLPFLPLIILSSWLKSFVFTDNQVFLRLIKSFLLVSRKFLYFWDLVVSLSCGWTVFFIWKVVQIYVPPDTSRDGESSTKAQTLRALSVMSQLAPNRRNNSHCTCSLD